MSTIVWPYTENLNSTNGTPAFQICTRAKAQPGAKMTQVNACMATQTMTDKGRLLSNA